MHYIFVVVTLNICMYVTYNNSDLIFFSLQIVTLTKESSWMWITMKDMALELSRFRFQKQMATKTVYIPSDIAVFNSVFCYVLSLVDSKKYDIDTFRSIHVPFSLWQRLVLKMFLISTCICDHLEIFFFFKFHLLKIYSISYNQLQMEATVVIRLRFVF